MIASIFIVPTPVAFLCFGALFYILLLGIYGLKEQNRKKHNKPEKEIGGGLIRKKSDMFFP